MTFEIQASAAAQKYVKTKCNDTLRDLKILAIFLVIISQVA